MTKGYCKSFGKWAYLYPDFIQFEGEEGRPAELKDVVTFGQKK